MPLGFKSDEQIEFWSRYLCEQNLLSKSIPSPSGLGVPGPLDQTLSKKMQD